MHVVGWERILPLVVQFGIGGVLGVVGVWAGISSGYLDMKLPADRRLVWIFAGGYAGLLLLMCLFTFWLPFVPGEAGP